MQGYALMCVAYPTSDVELETVTEDEIYELQFGKYFAQQVRRRGALARTHRPCRPASAVLGVACEAAPTCCTACSNAPRVALSEHA